MTIFGGAPALLVPDNPRALSIVRTTKRLERALHRIELLRSNRRLRIPILLMRRPVGNISEFAADA